MGPCLALPCAPLPCPTQRPPRLPKRQGAPRFHFRPHGRIQLRSARVWPWRLGARVHRCSSSPEGPGLPVVRLRLSLPPPTCRLEGLVSLVFLYLEPRARWVARSFPPQTDRMRSRPAGTGRGSGRGLCARGGDSGLMMHERCWDSRKARAVINFEVPHNVEPDWGTRLHVNCAPRPARSGALLHLLPPYPCVAFYAYPQLPGQAALRRLTLATSPAARVTAHRFYPHSSPLPGHAPLPQLPLPGSLTHLWLSSGPGA